MKTETQTGTKHSPLPWHYRDNWLSESNYGSALAMITSVNREANADFICRAVNSHYELVEALEAAFEWIDDVPRFTVLPSMPGVDRDWIDGILANAKGEQR